MSKSHKEMLANTTAAETALDLLSTIIPSEVLFHIPHSSSYIPSFEGYVGGPAAVKAEIDLLTDWHTDKVFCFDGVATVACAFSRVFCDVERLPDAEEPMFPVGRGFFYTHRDNGTLLRERSEQLAQYVWDLYYQPHHAALAAAVERIVKRHSRCLLIDCHSFSAVPFQTDLDQRTGRPDICLGTDEYHTPPWLIALFREAFQEAGFSVAVNTPYAGTIVPAKSYQRDQRVLSIMIELNRTVYMQADNSLIPEAVKKIRAVLARVLSL